MDAVTEEAVVVLQDRPLVPLSAWLARAVDGCARSGRTLQLVTSLGSRLSLPLRTAAAGAEVQWVVRDGDGYYEGLTGRPLRWSGATFVPVPEARDYAPGFTTRPAAPVGSQLTLVYRLRHAAGGELAGPVERLLHLVTGRPPAGFGSAEPLEHPWDGGRLAEYARERPTARVIVAGDGPRPAQAICEFSAADGGTAEVTTVTVGYAPQDPPPLRHLPSLVGAFTADQPVASLFVQLAPGRADLTTEPRWTGAAAPVALAVAGAVTGPEGVPGQQVGSPRAPLTLFPLGDGRSQDGWQRHGLLMRHLQPG